MTNDYFQRGIAAVNAGDLEHGVRCFELAVKQQAGEAEPLAYLGQTLFWLDRQQQGLACLRQAGQCLLKRAKKTKNFAEINALAAQLQDCHDYEGSIHLLQQAAALRKPDALSLQLLAQAYERTNRIAMALAAARLGVSLAPNQPALHVLLAGLEAKHGDLSAARQRLHRLLADEQALPGEIVYRAHKELALVLDKQGEYAAAFDQLQTAAAIGRQLPEWQAFDKRQIPQMLADYRDRLQRGASPANPVEEIAPDEPAPVFIVGFLRSGTTLVQEVVAAHSGVFVADETELAAALRLELNRMAGPQGTVFDQLERVGADGIRRLRRCYWHKAEQRYGAVVKQKLFVDKTTLNTLELGLLDAVFPDAKLIFVQRDPRDVCLSCFMQTLQASAVSVHLLDWRDTQRLYLEVMRWWLFVKPRLRMACCELRYEAAVTEFAVTFQALFAFLGLIWQQDVTEFHRQTAKRVIASPSYHQVSQPLYRSALGRWHRYPEAFAACDEDFSTLIAELGYR
ncbi:tetratricopeptide repeat-containing sulfotransferase family protein [Methylomonas rhizoryzae]|uniref:tetratricopeptide repeat-containing sulfotransferase family protein n=1 Tax=Methylomonas rhizoryzae TaxID=2608981 RepID=UPI001231E842|nr:sulfotransferase [Methylomonas rhizoryzae]